MLTRNIHICCLHGKIQKCINLVLSSLADLTDFLSGEDCVSISSIKSVIEHIHEKVLVERDDDVSLVRDMKRQICTDLDSRYINTKVNHLLNISSFLDPRFKLEHIAEESQTAFKEAVINALINEGLDIFDMAVEIEETDSAASSQSSLTLMNDDRPPPQRKGQQQRLTSRTKW